MFNSEDWEIHERYRLANSFEKLALHAQITQLSSVMLRFGKTLLLISCVNFGSLYFNHPFSHWSVAF